MISWMWLPFTALLAFELGRLVVQREWRRERDDEFERRMADELEREGGGES